MIIQFGSNPEYTIETWHDFTNWKLPFGVNWRWFTNVPKYKCFTIEFMFLCLGIQIEIWKWEKSK